MATDISGYWKTESGALYLFSVEEEANFVAIYSRPTSDQAACGVQPGDLAYRGNILGNILRGTFYHRFPLEARTRCPGIWMQETPLWLELSNNLDQMTGTLLLEHLPDDGCKTDDRKLDKLIFTRTGPDEKSTAQRTLKEQPTVRGFSTSV